MFFFFPQVSPSVRGYINFGVMLKNKPFNSILILLFVTINESKIRSDSQSQFLTSQQKNSMYFTHWLRNRQTLHVLRAQFHSWLRILGNHIQKSPLGIYTIGNDKIFIAFNWLFNFPLYLGQLLFPRNICKEKWRHYYGREGNFLTSWT